MRGMKLRALLLPGLAAGCAAPEAASIPLRPVHTYSIVARDPATGVMGVAVQSHWFNVGPIVAWAEAGVGAVATQSFVNVSFGPRGLAALDEGASPEDALAALLADDPGAGVRQVALIDTRGRVATHTGAECIAWAGHASGEGWSAQANMMWNDKVVPAMGAAFEAAEGELAHRLIAALEAAQAAGGDIRGQQSAAVKVVAAERTGNPTYDLLVDLRVEDHTTPVAELRRVYNVHRAYTHMNAGDAAMERSDFAAAMKEYSTAAELQPDNVEIRFWTAFTLATNNRLPEATPIFKDVFASNERWVELLKRLPDSDLCSPTLVARILEAARADK